MMIFVRHGITPRKAVYLIVANLQGLLHSSHDIPNMKTHCYNKKQSWCMQ